MNICIYIYIIDNINTNTHNSHNNTNPDNTENHNNSHNNISASKSDFYQNYTGNTDNDTMNINCGFGSCQWLLVPVVTSVQTQY